MANTELRRRIEILAQEFTDGVMNALLSAPLLELGSGLGGAGGRAARISAVGRAAGARGRRAAEEADGGATSARGGRGRRGPRKLDRRSGDEIKRIRIGILRVLSKASGSVGAREIAKSIGVGASDLSFPMKKLRDSKLVTKTGERTQAVYELTDKGRGVASAELGGAGGSRGGQGAKAAKKPGKKK
jgi:DNA-binding transcriptional ArsR family regulator